MGDVEPSDPATPPDAACEQNERGQLIARTIADLPEPLRVVLVLRHYEEMSFEQIARMLGTPASTVKSRFRAALQRLRERLRPLCDNLTEPER